MFAGITTTNYDHDGDHIIGMNSREGEQVPFSKPVIISEDPTIYKWLTRVEEAMQVSLATLLESSLKELEILDRNTQQNEFNQWIINYPA
jgi:dynein heavy chain 1, cytosolic